jgi:hypothetical protein
MIVARWKMPSLVKAKQNENYVPTFLESPALAWYGHLIPEDGLVDACDVKINWDSTHLGDDSEFFVSVSPSRIKDVAVFFYPKRLIHDPEHPLVLIADAFDDHYFFFTGGNVNEEWTDRDPLLATQQIWDDLCDCGFLNDAEAKRARLEFARIRECEWARDPNFVVPKGQPFTPENYQALDVALKKAEQRRIEIENAPPPPPPFIVHEKVFNCHFLNEEAAIRHYTASKKKAEQRLNEWEACEIIINRDVPATHAPIPQFEAGMWDDDKVMEQIGAWTTTNLKKAIEGLRKIEAGEVNEGKPGMVMHIGDGAIGEVE